MSTSINLGTATAFVNLDMTGLLQGVQNLKQTLTNVGQSFTQTRQATNLMQTGFAQAKQIIDQVVQSFGKTTDGSKSLKEAFKQAGDAGNELKNQLISAGVAATGLEHILESAMHGAIDLIKESKNQYRDFTEQVNRSQVIFQQSSKTILDWAKTSKDSTNLSEIGSLRAVGSFGTLFQQLGLGSQKTAEMSQRMVKLAADLTSLHNPADGLNGTIEALVAGLNGMPRPLREFGIYVDEAKLKERAFAMGLVKSAKEELPDEIKSLAAYTEILHQAAYANGDLERTTGSVANKERRLKADIEDLQKSIGEGLMPTWGKMLKEANDWLKILGDTKTAMEENLKERKPPTWLETMVDGWREIYHLAKDTAGLDASTAVKENTPLAKITTARLDEKTFRNFDGEVTPDLIVRAAKYGIDINTSMSAAAAKEQLDRAANIAEDRAQVGQYHFNQARKAAMAPPPPEIVGAVPSWLIRQQLEDEDRADAAAAKEEKRRAAAEAKAERELEKQKDELLKPILTGTDRNPLGDDINAMLQQYQAAVLGQQNQMRRMFKPGGINFLSGMASSLNSSFHGAKIEGEHMAYDADRAARMSADELTFQVETGQIPIPVAIKALQDKIIQVGQYNDQGKRYQEQVDALTVFGRRTAYQGVKDTYKELGDWAIEMGNGDSKPGSINAGEGEGTKQPGYSEDKLAGFWKQLADGISQSLQTVTISFKTFQSFYKSLMQDLLQTTREVLAQIAKEWATKKLTSWATTAIGGALGSAGGPFGEILGAIGGSVLGNIIGGHRSVSIPGYRGPSTSRSINIAFHGPVTMGSSQDIETLSNRIALHINRESRVRAA